MNGGSDEAELLAAFSQIALKQLREVLEDVSRHADEAMFTLAETGEDAFFRTHVRDVLSELRQETRAIQLSFATDLRTRFQAALHPGGAEPPSGRETGSAELASASMQACQEKWLPSVADLGTRMLRRLAGNDDATGTLPLPLTPVDIGEAYFRALDSVPLPVHGHVKACLADLLAKRLDETLGKVYGRFAEFLESGVGLEPEEDDTLFSESGRRDEASSTDAGQGTPGAPDAATDPTPQEPAAPEQLKPHAPNRMGPLEALAAREMENAPAEPATLPPEPAEPQTLTVPEPEPAEVQSRAVPEDRVPSEPDRPRPSPAGSRLVLAGVVCLLAVVFILARYPEKQKQSQALSIPTASPLALPVVAAAPTPLPTPGVQATEPARPVSAQAPSSMAPPTAEPATAILNLSEPDKPQAPSHLPESPTDAPAPTAPLTEPSPHAAAVQPTISQEAPSPSVTPNPRVASAQVVRKVKLKSYDWLRNRGDNTIRMRLRVFNGSSSRIRRIGLRCTAYSEGLSRLQSTGKTLEVNIAPGSSVLLRHLNLGRLRRETARISCAVESLEVN